MSLLHNPPPEGNTGLFWLIFACLGWIWGWMITPLQPTKTKTPKKGPGTDGAPPASSSPRPLSLPAPPAPPESIHPLHLVPDGLIDAPTVMQARGVQKIHPGWLPYLVCP